MLGINYNAAYVVNGGSNDISVINLSNNTTEASFSLNGSVYPHHIYLNPGKTKLAVAITGTDLSGGHGGGHHHGGSGTNGFKVLIIDVVSGNIDKELLLYKLPHNAIFHPTTKELWVGQSDEEQSQIWVYETENYTLRNVIITGKGLSEITFSPDGSKAFAANTIGGDISVIDVASKTIIKTITVGTDPVGAWPGISNSMFADNETSQTISEISLNNLEVVNTIDLGYKPGYVAQHSSGELWVTDATNGLVHFYQKTGNNWEQTGQLATGADAHAIGFSSDQTRGYITNQGAQNVSVIDAIAHKTIATIPVGNKPNGIAIREF